MSDEVSKVAKYRKLPVEIKAMYVDPDDYDAVCECIRWCGGRAVGEEAEPHLFAIDTLEGSMYADAGDYIIQGVKGEFYPCKPDIFEATYELVDE